MSAWDQHKSDYLKWLSIEAIQKAIDAAYQQSIEPHRHLVNPRGGYCECGLYISADDLRAAGLKVPR